MTIQMLGNIVLIIALIGLIGYKQLTWQPVRVARMWRMPLILGGAGLVALSQMSNVQKLTTMDIAVLLIELVVSLGIGAFMGSLATFRPLLAERAATLAIRTDRRGRQDATPAAFETRTGWLGLALWAVFIAVRVGIDAWAGAAGSTLAASTGVILVMIAANRLARVGVFAARIDKLDRVAV